MIKLNTTYLGMELKNPLVVSAGPLSRDLSNLKKMEDAHASAIVLHSLFEEQIDIEANNLDDTMWAASDVSAEAQGYYPELSNAAPLGPQEYLEHVRKCKAAVGVPVIASLNGSSKGGWTKYAKLMQEAGADALELNIYYLATNADDSGAEIEKRYVDLVKEVKKSVTIPVAVKLGPYFSAMANMGKQLDNAGADGLVLFNRFYQTDFDLETLEAMPRMTLSRSAELTLRLHWTAVLYGKIKADIAVTGGVHVAEDVVKAMMAGGKIIMMTSALLEQGIGYLHVLENHLVDWLDKHEYESIEQMQGSMSYKNVAHPAAFERANYLKVLNSYSLGLPLR